MFSFQVMKKERGKFQLGLPMINYLFFDQGLGSLQEHVCILFSIDTHFLRVVNLYVLNDFGESFSL